MYIYEAKNLEVGRDAYGNGLLFKSTKDDAAQFVPAKRGEICGLIVPRHGDGEQLVCSSNPNFHVNYAEEDEDIELINADLKIFAFQGEITGVPSGEHAPSTIKGLIFKAVRGQEECSKEMTNGDIVSALVEKEYNRDTNQWETLDTPVLSELMAIKANQVMFSQESYTFGEGSTYDLSDQVLCVPIYSELTWKSSDEEIATVDDTGLVTFVTSAGDLITVTITATIAGTDASASCKVIKDNRE